MKNRIDTDAAPPSPREQGAQAFRDGVPLSENPFVIDSDDALHWQDGWDAEEVAAYGDE